MPPGTSVYGEELYGSLVLGGEGAPPPSLPPIEGGEEPLLSAWGLEARHSFDGKITLNKWVDDTGAVLWPHYKLDSITGLHGLPDFADDRMFATARQGEIPLTSFRRGRTVVYEGRVRAQTLADMRVAEANLVGAFAPTEERQMVVTPHPLYSTGSRFFFARAISLDVPEAQGAPSGGDRGFSRRFALSLRASDSRLYDGAIVASQTGIQAAGGGMALPVLFPVQIEGSTDTSADAECINTGTIDTDAVVDIYGPVTDPVIRNLTTGARLRFKQIELSAGDFLRVDFKTRDVLLNGTVAFRQKVDTINSDWWDAGEPCLVPGINVIRLRAPVLGAAAKAVISFHPAYSG